MIYTPTLLSVEEPFPGFNQATIQCQEKIEHLFIPATSIHKPKTSLVGCSGFNSAVLFEPVASCRLRHAFLALPTTITVFAMYHDEAGSVDLMALFPDLCSLWPRSGAGPQSVIR